MLNFDYLKNIDYFSDFTQVCIDAEKSIGHSPITCAFETRRALEQVIRYIYRIDSDLELPYTDTLSALIHNDSFQEIIDHRILPMMDFIRTQGNIAAHTNKIITREAAVLCLNNLYQVVKWVLDVYSDENDYNLYHNNKFDESLLSNGDDKVDRKELAKLEEEYASKEKSLKEEIEQIKEELRKQYQERKVNNKKDHDINIDTLPEWKTRKIYIDTMLRDSGWDFDNNVEIEFPVHHMPFGSHDGYVDYVLHGKNGRPIAVIEAKKAIKDAHVGQQQAKIYADNIEKEYGIRPIIFYTNGFEIYLWDDLNYPERRISGFLTQDEIELLIQRRKTKKSILSPDINDNITNRYYQKEAIINVCESFEKKQRKALLVMATGSGKTRVSISLVDVLLKNNWVKNILFLADRTELVRQAKENFAMLLPSLTTCNLLENKDDPEISRMIFSTYPTMMNAIDTSKTKSGERLFTPGHFDLIILDESHRSIYNKYKEIFDYFDALLVGLTATPKSDIGKNTYEIFNLEDGVPTYAYEYSEAVNDHYLVPFSTLSIDTGIMDDGISYDDLDEQERIEWEEKFGLNIDHIDANLINKVIFNKDTIKLVIDTLMEKGIKINDGDLIGKTIIFATNEKHAEAIVETINEMYPNYGGNLARKITYSVNYAQDLIDKFKQNGQPQIAVSVDMLDTGVDIPEVVNLVFFKKVRSKAKFWQMIGRGTRLSKNLFGPGEDKQSFIIFDGGKNIEYFKLNPNAQEIANIGMNISQRIFNFKLDIMKELQSLKYKNDEKLIEFDQRLINETYDSISELNREAFYVKQHLRAIDTYHNKDKLSQLGIIDMNTIKEEISPLITIIDNDIIAKRFDATVYSIELDKLIGHNATKKIKPIIANATILHNQYGNNPLVQAHQKAVVKAMDDTFWANATIVDMDYIREELRSLIKIIEHEPKGPKYFRTHFDDDYTKLEEGDVFFDTVASTNYKEKVQHYLQDNLNDGIVSKIRNNEHLNEEEIKEIQDVFWIQLGNRDQYKIYFGETPLLELIRKQVGLSHESANALFSKFINDNSLNATQIRFVRLIMNYVEKNGFVEDKKVFIQEPFKTVGSMAVIFKDKMNIARDIMTTVDQLKDNLRG